MMPQTLTCAQPSIHSINGYLQNTASDRHYAKHGKYNDDQDRSIPLPQRSKSPPGKRDINGEMIKNYPIYTNEESFY